MTAFQDLQCLFEEVVDLEPDARSYLLKERLGATSPVIDEIEALILFDRAQATSGELLAMHYVEGLVDEPAATALEGDRFGPYVVESLMASGGMGHVYRAARSADGITRRVAIKVLRHGLDTKRFLESFDRERRTLAGLEHENIVSFLDAGSLPDGRPFLVMELVDGLPLTQWCAQCDGGLRRILQVFLRVLSAVEYAHHCLVVHRDLKPSNVLVTARGVPKLLDFGVAGMLDAGQGWSESEGPNSAGPMTLAYASPEQVRGDPVTTSSDVFSLGVMLHELIVGKTPEDLDAPVRPSDLDHVIQKALHPDPKARYASVARFADDLRNHLARRPVVARGGGWMYRFNRFLARHAWPTALASSLVLAMAMGLVGSEMGRQRAQREASLGWGAHGAARKALIFCEELLISEAGTQAETADRSIAACNDALRERFRDAKEGEALVRLLVARLLLQRGDAVSAAPHLERVLEICRKIPGLASSLGRRAVALLPPR